MSAVDSGGGWFSVVRESFAGAFQANVAVDAPREVLTFSAVFACVTIIASDIAKLGIGIMMVGKNGIGEAVSTASPFARVLAKPNSFQTWYKFIEQWIVSKLLYGNAYILKQRDGANRVVALYVLDGQRVTPLVADDGSVFYQLAADHLSGLKSQIVVPASEIIHDMMVSLWHPLVGVSPIYACGVSATMGNRIQANSTTFFGNASRPVGILVAPGAITQPQADQYKQAWEENYGGNNRGRTAVLGNGLTYQQLTIPATDSQLLEQLKWTVEDVARCFHVPMYKIGGPEPARVSVESLNQTYYSDCLQALIESAEALLCDGLALPADYCVEFDLDNLMRMDTAARYAASGTAVKDGWMKPNEARAREGLQPIAGGDTCYLQQQYYSLEALSKRDGKEDPFGKAAPSALPAPEAPEAPDAIDAEEADAETKELIDRITKGLLCDTSN